MSLPFYYFWVAFQSHFNWLNDGNLFHILYKEWNKNVEMIYLFWKVYFFQTSKVCDEKRTPRRCILWICLFIFLYATIYCILAQPRFTYINKLKWIGSKYTEHFQPVLPGKSYIFVFSAFKLSSDNDRVSIVSIVDKNSPLHEFKCILRGKGNSTEKWTNATLEEYPESHNRR